MKNFKKLMSLFLAVLMLSGVMTSLAVIPAGAADAAGDGSSAPEEETKTIDYLFTEIYGSPEEKLATMKEMTTKGKYTIYALESSGEVAIKDNVTGQILFTNPYDIGTTTASDSVKHEIMSQIIVKFDENGREREYKSFEYAAMRNQIKVKNIKNGIRVEYTIGREEARRLVPRMIEKDRFETMIQAPMEEYYGVTYEEAKEIKDIPKHPLQSASFYLCKQMSYFVFKSLDNCSTDRLKEDLKNSFPIVTKMDIYVLDPSAKTIEIEKIEEVIKTACPNYSYEELDYDHQLTEYVGEEENPPVFKMALEYTLDADGFTVRLPANGIRFNESKFQLTNVSVLPYMGAGNNAYNGYTFYPDGSGALFAFEDLADQNTYSVASKIYGTDYAYHQLSGTYQQAVRYPVFGIVENTEYYDCVYIDEKTGEEKTQRISGVAYEGTMKAIEEGKSTSPLYKKFASLLSDAEVSDPITESRGFVAIIEEGDALTELKSYHAGVLSPYDTVQMEFNPRPKDSYNVADAISVGTNSEWTVVSNRKYVGNYKIRYIMLADDDVAAKKTEEAKKEGKTLNLYSASWLGMAMAYRDYLTTSGVLSPLSQKSTTDNIPLYIESFGAAETVEKYLSVPVEVMKPLTSAQDVITMYEELAEKAGATNINFKLTGYANGGLLYSSVPYRLKWEKVVGKDVSMQELFDYAANLENGELGLFPEFDFSYKVSDKLFDGFSSRKHAVRTIDDRVSYKREYMPTQQRYFGRLKLAISPAYFDHFYEKLMANYLGYDNVTGISVGSLGNALNSDFDEDEPYNREDSKSFVTKALEYISGKDDTALEVMVDGGNAYTWKHVDHILGAALDSSRYIKASYSVPFVGVVLHGYMNFAGTPLNMEGDVNYAKLKAIENGASPYFTLSYQNTQILKENNELSKYYSIRYDIWFDDVVEIYSELNSVMKDVQNKIIVDHQFLAGMRVPDVDELDRDTDEVLDSIMDFLDNKAEYEAKQKAEAVADARDKIASVEVAFENFVKDYLTHYSGMSGAAYLYVTGDRSFERRFANFVEANAAFESAKAAYDAADDAGKKELLAAYEKAEATQKQAYGQLRTYIRNVGRAIKTIENEYKKLVQLYEDAKKGKILIQNTEGCPQSILDEIEAQLEKTEELMATQMGVKFEMTVDKAEVDTFLRTHISTLIFSAYGEPNHATIGVVGKAENLYNMLASGNYGLMTVELDLLRYLEANRNMTDEELKAKYGLKDDETSVSGLIQLVYELLGDDYQFDPIIANTGDNNNNGIDDGIENNIQEYIEAMLFDTVTSLGNGSVIASLNFVPTRVDEEGKILSNTSNINAVTNLIDNEIKAVLTGKDGAISTVTDGNYNLDAIFTDDQMKTLIEKAVDIIMKNTRAPQNPKPTNPVEYATSDEDQMKVDLKNYIESVYYKEVLVQINPGVKTKLYIQNVSYMTNSSIELLVSLRLNAYGEIDSATKFHTYFNNLWTDADLKASLNSMNDSVKGAYDDVLAKLEKSYSKQFATAVLNGAKAPTLQNLSYEVVNGESKDKHSLREEGAAILKAANLTADSTPAEVEAVIAQIVALHDEYIAAGKLEADYDATAEVGEYVCYNVLGLLKEQTVNALDNFYYDEQLAKADDAIRDMVMEKNTEILAGMPEVYTTYQLYDAIMQSLADSEYSAMDFAADVAAQVTHVAEGKNSIKNDVLAYYCYLLLNSFENNKLDTAPTITITQGNVKNALAILDNDFKDRLPLLIAEARSAAKRGEQPNYALSSFLTEEEINGIADELVSALIKAKFSEENERETLRPQVRVYLEHAYYLAVRDRLNASKIITDTSGNPIIFHVSEVYGTTLYDAASELKSLMYYFVTAKTDMSATDIDRYIGGGGNNNLGAENEEEEASRYLSDDGRIVSVTYGDKNADGSYSAYKTFILNYNNFSVSVVYEDVTYTIPAYGYVVVMH